MWHGKTYCVFHILNLLTSAALFSSAFAEYARYIASPTNVTAALAEDWESVDGSAALKVLKRGEHALDAFKELSELGILPTESATFCKTHKYAAIVAKKASDFNDQVNKTVAERLADDHGSSPRKKAGTTDAQRKRKQSPTNSGTERNSKNHKASEGAILVTGNIGGKAVCPPVAKLTEEACGIYHTDGTVCRWGRRCKYSYVDINDLGTQDQKAWVRHILTNPNLRFNPDMVNARIRGMTLADAAEE